MERLTKAMDKYLSEAKKKYSAEAKKKVLKLVVSKQWLDMIVSGEKTEEYREIKPYWASRLVNQNAESGMVGFDEFGGYTAVIGEPEYKPYPTSSSLTATARIVHELRRRLRVSPSARLRKAYAPTSGLVPSFSSLSSSSV